VSKARDTPRCQFAATGIANEILPSDAIGKDNKKILSHGKTYAGACLRILAPPRVATSVAGYLPETRALRFVDENGRRARPSDFAWADVVLVTGMHIQAAEIHDVHQRARRAGKVTVLGGPSGFNPTAQQR
jgi:hypothetical protein